MNAHNMLISLLLLSLGGVSVYVSVPLSITKTKELRAALKRKAFEANLKRFGWHFF
jgi:hypothetical protein